MPVSTGTSTIGAGGDYSTLAAWVSALPSDLTTGPNAGPQTALLLNQAHALGGGVTLSGITTDAINKITIKCQVGASFRDNLGTSNPLVPGASFGAILTTSGTFLTGLTIGVSNVTLFGVQIDTTGDPSGPIAVSGAQTNIVLDSCLFRGRNGAYVARLNDATNTIKNCLLISAGASGDGVSTLGSPGCNVLDCTIVRPSDQAAAGTGVATSYAGTVVKGTAIFGFSAAATGSPGACGNNATDQATMGTLGGAGNLTGQAYSAQFQGSDGTDYRLVSGSTLSKVGVAIGGITTDIIGTVRPITTDIGAWQTANGPALLVAGSVSTSGVTSSSATVSGTAATGGTAPLAYQFRRSPDNGANASTGAWVNIGPAQPGVAAGTAPAPVSDLGLTSSTKYWYACVVTDSASTPVMVSSAPVSVTTQAPSATSFTLTGPTSGTAGVVSANFNVTPNNPYTGTVTPSDGGVGGTFTPVALNYTASSAAQQFTYTPQVAGTNTISASANPALTNASGNATFSVSPAPLAEGSMAAAAAPAVRLTAPVPTGGIGPYAYQFQRAPDVGGVPGTWAFVGPISTVTSLVDSGVSALTKYWYRVSVTDSATPTANQVTSAAVVFTTDGVNTLKTFGQIRRGR